jgi:hypothetical protein
MHPVPPDWALDNAVKPQEQEDNNPDKKTPAITKEGATKVDHQSEFFENDKEHDNNNDSSSSSSSSNNGNNNDNESDMKKRKLVVGDNSEKNTQISDKLAVNSDENLGKNAEEKISSEIIDEKNGESVAMDVVDDGDKEVVQGGGGKVEVEVEKGILTGVER